jgi:hypothetical protein
LGSYAGYNSTGSCNTFIGAEAAYLNTTSDNLIVIGYAASSSSTTVCNEITLGNSAITCIRANVQTISSLSDARDKKNATALPVGLNLIRELKPVEFTWDQRDGNRVGDLDTGFLAQDLDAAQCAVGYEVPGLVNKDNPDRYEASYGKLLPVLVKAIQELNEELTSLKQEFNDYRSTHP